MKSSSDTNIKYSIDEGIFVLEIHRPEKKNALTPSMYQALGDGIEIANADDDVNVILIKGIDDCFTSGNDVHGFTDTQSNLSGNSERPSSHFMQAISTSEKPVVAAISGLAVGIGTTLLLHCDLVYAAEDCFLQLPFTRLGLCPELASSVLLPYFMGHQRASELLMLGDRFSAEQACAYGIVNKVLPRGEYLDFAMSKARELAALPPDSVQTTKRLMKQQYQHLLPNIIDDELKEFGRLLKSPEAQTIIQGFLNRKKAG